MSNFKYYWDSMKNAPRLATEDELNRQRGISNLFSSKDVIEQKMRLKNEDRKKRAPFSMVSLKKKKTNIEYKIKKLQDDLYWIDYEIDNMSNDAIDKRKELYDKEMEAYIQVLNTL